MCGAGGMHCGGRMCGRGACVAGVCVWQGACVAGGACMAGVHAWHACPPPWQILRDTVNERAVRILLECILVAFAISIV